MIDSIRIALAKLEQARVLSIGQPPSFPPWERGDERGVRHSKSENPPTGDIISNRKPADAQDTSDDGVLVVPGDMPQVSTESCRTCVAAFTAATERIVIATYNGKRGHPMIFPLNMRPAIATLQGGLRELPLQHPERVHLIEIDDPGVVRDVDTPEDFDRL